MPEVDFLDNNLLVRLAGTLLGITSNPITTYVQTTDPGAVGASNLWLRSTLPAAGSVFQLYVRNAANDAWLAVGQVHYDEPGMQRGAVLMEDDDVLIVYADAAGVQRCLITLENGLIGLRLDDSLGNERASVLLGEGVIVITATDLAGSATTLTVSASGGITLDDPLSGIQLPVGPTHKLGFFGTAPVARPSVPAVPTAQNVVDALKTLGLITQLP